MYLSPYPQELLPLLPLDGADNRFGQMNARLLDSPYSNAGVTGFERTQPYKEESISLLAINPDLMFPSLVELNAELDDLTPEEADAIFNESDPRSDIKIFTTPAVDTPAPPATAPETPRVPEIGPLMASLLASTDKLFFVAHKIPGSSTSEWALVRVDIMSSLRENPSALSDGRVIAEFYTCHSSDKLYKATNQRYWLEYHPQAFYQAVMRYRMTHLIRTTADSPKYAKDAGLAPFLQWIRLTNADT
jgi:hypothetical protein